VGVRRHASGQRYSEEQGLRPLHQERVESVPVPTRIPVLAAVFGEPDDKNKALQPSAPAQSYRSRCRHHFLGFRAFGYEQAMDLLEPPLPGAHLSAVPTQEGGSACRPPRSYRL